MPVLLLVQGEVRGGVLPDIVTDPPAGGDEVLRMLIAQVHEDPERGLDRILGALRPVTEPRVPRAAALGLDLDRDSAGVGEAAGQESGLRA